MKPDSLKLCLLLFFYSCLNAGAGDYPLWGDLQPGMYRVGFTTRFQYDESRTFRSKYDATGKLQKGERARPIQITVWYPAQKSSSGDPMKYQDYVYLLAQELSFGELTEEMKQASVAQYLEQNRNANQAPVESSKHLLQSVTAAIHEAPAETGGFPLLIYAPGASGTTFSNSILCEYLASHGYVVAALPSLGQYSRSATIDLAGFYAYMEDIEFVIGFMRHFPNVDYNHLGLIGFSMGGSAATLVQMRNMDIDAAVYLDTGMIYNILDTWFRSSPYYNPTDLRAPQLYLTRSDAGNIDLNFLDKIPFADAYSLLFEAGYRHVDYISEGMFAEIISGYSPESSKKGSKKLYEAVCQYTLHFLDGYLKEDPESLKWIASDAQASNIPKVTLEVRKAMMTPPREPEYANLIREGGIEKAKQIYTEIKRTHPELHIFRESTLNGLGYEFLFRGNAMKAIEVFELNAEAYPQSANVYDSLSDAYDAAGNSKRALELAQKALDLLPADSSLDKLRKEAIKKAAETRIQKLKQG